MARGVNKVILIGNLGADPEVRYTPNGNAVANVSLATSSSWRDKQSGELIEKTEWHRIIFFNRLAEIVGEYLHKGSKIFVEGSLRTRKWQDKSGVDRYTTEIIANEMQMLDNRVMSGNGNSNFQPGNNGNAGNGGNQQNYNQSNFNNPQTSQTTNTATSGNVDGNNGNNANFDDDIPF